MSSSTRAPGVDSWLTHTVVLAGDHAPKYSAITATMPSMSRMSVRYLVTLTTSVQVEALVVEDRLDGVHGAPGLVLDAHGVIVLGELVGVLVVEGRGGGAGDEEQVAGRLDADGRRVGHVGDAGGLGVDLADAGVGGGGAEGGAARGHGDAPGRCW